MTAPRTVKAFDADEIHAGNFALGIDHEKAARETDALMERMSLEQKIHEIRGHGPRPVDSLWCAGGDAALGLAAWRMVDGPRGARAGVATAFPVAIARAASFDVDLERRVGMATGLEVAAKGGNVLLAPTINLLRHPGWGRAQETYSEDPHHMGAMAAAYVSGAQNHVLTSPKHFALNNLENTRFEMSADVDARTLHEVYLPHFKRCVVEVRAASVMSAYNKLNGVYCGENPELLDAILRGDWGFTGFVESDWFLGTRSTAPAIRAGMDIEMPAGFRFSDENLQAALASGEIDEAAIHRNARRSVYQKLAWQLTEDGVAGKPRPDASVVECDDHLALALEAAEKSVVLLRNEGDVLPVGRHAGVSIAVVGDLADAVNLGDRGSSMVTPSHVVKPLEGIRASAGDATVEHFASNADLSRLGEFDVAVVVAGLTYRDEGEFIPTAQQEAEDSDLARGGDRATLDLPADQRDLIERATAAARRTVVVLQGGSAIVVRDWIDRVDGLLMAWYGGCQGGHGLARVLFGDASPSGRLPVSFPRAMDQLMPWDIAALSVKHGLLHGYRWLDHHGHEPEFPFGFGLGYTSFQLRDLRLERVGGGLTVRVDVQNTGTRAGATVVQLYRGSVLLRPGGPRLGARAVPLPLPRRAVVGGPSARGGVDPRRSRVAPSKCGDAAGTIPPWAG
ncbi:MAG: glycoside hydrolase family 3 C-terminal domain-containing protein [Deltaproteobacteria bacterium]|nr:glycoside hydrolase family 3 C-terminal domain-containing protein [Deltaproteobacteria bacterium]